EKKRIRRTRKNRINLSERLKKYDRKWKNIIFLLNIVAVILIIIVISKFSYSRPVEVFAGAFSAYVILLQYFINEQKYGERALKAHYHQLELADILNEMDQICFKYKHLSVPNDKTIEEYIDRKEKLLDKYQLSLKNNENHLSIVHLNNSMYEKVIILLLYVFLIGNIFSFLNLLFYIGVLLYIINEFGDFFFGL